MSSDHKLKILYTHACAFLRGEIGDDALEKELAYYRAYRVDSMPDVFWYLVRSLKNKRNMGETIGDIDDLSPFLFHFDAPATHVHYGGDWRRLFTDIKNKHTPPGPMNIENKSSYWVIFAKGILSAAAFLSRFDSFESFDKFVNSFSFNHLSVAALPILLEQEIYGLGFPLACDFLKEIGCVNYAKPDVHIKDILFETGVVTGRESYEAFKTMIRMARVNKELPVIVDYMLWMIGSGRFSGEHGRKRVQKQRFIEQICNKLDRKMRMKGNCAITPGTTS